MRQTRNPLPKYSTVQQFTLLQLKQQIYLLKLTNKIRNSVSVFTYKWIVHDCVMLPNTKPRMQICIGSQHVAQSNKNNNIYVDEKHNLVTLFSHQLLSLLVMNLEFGLNTGTHYLMTLPGLCIIYLYDLQIFSKPSCLFLLLSHA